MQIRVLTLNIHKGFTSLNSRFVLHELREAIRATQADIVFLQEVQGEHATFAQRHAEWPDQAQYEFLADEVWSDYAYGKNAVYDAGHHGNAILSKFPIRRFEKVDISTNRVEQRGLLWCEVHLPNLDRTLHCVCVHLGLSAVARRKQLSMIARYVNDTVPRGEPYIIAGDFNDWSGVPTRKFAYIMGLDEAYFMTHGRPAKTFPARRPVLGLDKILIRGLTATDAETFCSGVWTELSDHAALVADLRLTERTARARLGRNDTGATKRVER